MKQFRWFLIIALIAVIVISALLYIQRRIQPHEAENIESPTQGGVYIEALIGTPSRFNPLLDYYNGVDRDVDRLIYCRLIQFDYRGLPQPDLADSWGISQDGKTYNFSIHPQAVWHDGQPVTSEDIAFTVELMKADEIPLPEDLKAFWRQIKVKPLDEKTLQFQLPEPFAPFLDYLTFGILPAHLLKELTVNELLDSSFNLQPVGCGAFQFDSLNIEQQRISAVTLKAFHQYYARPPFLEQVIFKYYPDGTSAYQAYSQGEVMGISQVTQDILFQVLHHPQLNVFTGRLPRLSIIFLNLDSPDVPYFQDENVRRALLMGINRRWIIEHIFQGQAILAHGPVFPDSWAYYESIPQVGYDPERAIKLLREAGYTLPAEGGQVRAKEGVAMAFEMVYPSVPPFDQIAQRIQSDWLKLGVQANLIAVSYEELLADFLNPRNYQAALVELNFERSPDPDPYPFWHQAQISGGQNYSAWDDRQVSEYLEQARVDVDFEERARLYRNFQVRFSIELPALPLFYPVYTYAVDSRVKGLSMGPLYDPSDRFSTINFWYLFSEANLLQNTLTATP